MITKTKKNMQGALYVQFVLFKKILSFQNLFEKFCFVNYLVNKRTLTLKIKKQVASPER